MFSWVNKTVQGLFSDPKEKWQGMAWDGTSEL